jgi:hypothetical protein
MRRKRRSCSAAQRRCMSKGTHSPHLNVSDAAAFVGLVM